MTTPRPVVLLHPWPQAREAIFDAPTWSALNERFDVREYRETDDDRLDADLPEALAIVGQPDLPAERLARATRLRALCNVEGNFFPNVDYAACFDRGIHVLGCGPAYAQPVAEYALGLALDLARGISREDRPSVAGPSATPSTATPTRSCCATRISASSGSGTSAARCSPCCGRSPPASGPTTRGCRTPSCGTPTSSRPGWRRCSPSPTSSSCSPR
jgi:lactate dehydrogenase-like 2-hydroxyacid dehydrogenase